MGKDTARLVRLAAAGNPDAAHELIERFWGKVRDAIHRSLGPELRLRVDTDDLFQSTISVALADLPGQGIEDEAALLGWLLTVAERRVLMAARFHRAGKRDPRKCRRIATSESLPGSVTRPDVRAERADEARQVREAIQRLPSRDRDVLELRSFEGMGFREIAERLGISGEDAARQRFQRALKRLGDQLDS